MAAMMMRNSAPSPETETLVPTREANAMPRIGPRRHDYETRSLEAGNIGAGEARGSGIVADVVILAEVAVDGAQSVYHPLTI